MAENPIGQPGGGLSDFLDQSEIDKLLQQTVETTKQSILHTDGRALDASKIKIEPYDFRNPVFLTEIELRRLRILHEDFIRYLAARLSLFLRMDFGLKMAKLTTLSYAKFTDSLPSPTHICLFKVEPLLGVGVLDINPRLALTLADRMLGGRGHSIKGERYLTEIEIALVEDVIGIVLEEWCQQWKVEQELHPTIIGHENNGRFLQTSPRDSIILVLALEVSFGDCSEQIQIGVPYYTIEPVVKKMQNRRQKEATISKAEEKKPVWKDSCNHIDIPVRAEWDACELSLREVTHLRVGDIIEMPMNILSKTKVILASTPKFVGTVGLEDQSVVVQLTDKLPKQ